MARTSLNPPSAETQFESTEPSATRGGFCVYFITDNRNRYVKIGVSSDPLARLSAIQSGSAIGLKIEHLLLFREKRQAFIWEDAAHQHFAAHWRHGEWFNYAAPIKKFVRSSKRGDAVNVPMPARTCKQHIAQWGAPLTKIDLLTQLRDAAVSEIGGQK